MEETLEEPEEISQLGRSLVRFVIILALILNGSYLGLVFFYKENFHGVVQVLFGINFFLNTAFNGVSSIYTNRLDRVGNLIRIISIRYILFHIISYAYICSYFLYELAGFIPEMLLYFFFFGDPINVVILALFEILCFQREATWERYRFLYDEYEYRTR